MSSRFNWIGVRYAMDAVERPECESLDVVASLTGEDNGIYVMAPL